MGASGVLQHGTDAIKMLPSREPCWRNAVLLGVCRERAEGPGDRGKKISFLRLQVRSQAVVPPQLPVSAHSRRYAHLGRISHGNLAFKDQPYVSSNL